MKPFVLSGSWDDYPDYSSVACPGWDSPVRFYYRYLGFRLVRSR